MTEVEFDTVSITSVGGNCDTYLLANNDRQEPYPRPHPMAEV